MLQRGDYSAQNTELIMSALIGGYASSGPKLNEPLPNVLYYFYPGSLKRILMKQGVEESKIIVRSCLFINQSQHYLGSYAYRVLVLFLMSKILVFWYQRFNGNFNPLLWENRSQYLGPNLTPSLI